MQPQHQPPAPHIKCRQNMARSCNGYEEYQHVQYQQLSHTIENKITSVVVSFLSLLLLDLLLFSFRFQPTIGIFHSQTRSQSRATLTPLTDWTNVEMDGGSATAKYADVFLLQCWQLFSCCCCCCCALLTWFSCLAIGNSRSVGCLVDTITSQKLKQKQLNKSTFR